MDAKTPADPGRGGGHQGRTSRSLRLSYEYHLAPQTENRIGCVDPPQQNLYHLHVKVNEKSTIVAPPPPTTCV